MTQRTRRVPPGQFHPICGRIVRTLFEIVMEQPGIQRKAALHELVVRLPDLDQLYVKQRAHHGITGAYWAGWLLKPQGQLTVTAAGRDAYGRYPDPEEFHRELDRLYHLNRKKSGLSERKRSPCQR